MKIVIQCAGKKKPNAGTLRTGDGRRVCFVAHPEAAEPSSTCVFARPDDLSENGRTWRERLLSYNREPGGNPLGLLPAAHLYDRDIYPRLYRRFGTDLYILSAGWGLIPGGFLTPSYDVTFSSSADNTFRRRSADAFKDWSMIENGSTEPLVFLGGKDYLPHFAKLTGGYQGPRIALYNSASSPNFEGVTFVRYNTSTRTNWHYGAAEAILDGRIDLPNFSGL